MFSVILCVAYRSLVTCPKALKLTNVTENEQLKISHGPRAIATWTVHNSVDTLIALKYNWVWALFGVLEV